MDIIIHCVCGHSLYFKRTGEKKRCICGRMLYATDEPNDTVRPWMVNFDKHVDDGRRVEGEFVVTKTGRKQRNS